MVLQVAWAWLGGPCSESVVLQFHGGWIWSHLKAQWVGYSVRSLTGLEVDAGYFLGAQLGC